MTNQEAIKELVEFQCPNDEARNHAITMLERVEKLQSIIIEADFGEIVELREYIYGDMSKTEHVNSSLMFVKEFLFGNPDAKLIPDIDGKEAK